MISRRMMLPIMSLLTFMSLFFASIFATPAHAQVVSCGEADRENGTLQNQVIGLPSWDKYLQCDTSNNDAVTNFAFPDDIWLVLLAGIEILTRVAVYIAIGVIIYAGINMTISQGNPEKIQGAKSTIEQGIVGLAISILATTIIVFIGGSIT